MRKLYISLLLPFLMLLVQQGAVWHELGHLGTSSDTTAAASSSGPHDKVQQDDGLTGDKLCETCLAFAQLSGTAKTEVPLLDLLSGSNTRAPGVATHVVTADAPALHNRGPPSFL